MAAPQALTDEVLVRLPFIQRQLYAEGLSHWGTQERRFFGGLAQKPGNFAFAHVACNALVSMVFGCRPPFPMGISDIMKLSSGDAYVVATYRARGVTSFWLQAAVPDGDQRVLREDIGGRCYSVAPTEGESSVPCAAAAIPVPCSLFPVPSFSYSLLPTAYSLFPRAPPPQTICISPPDIL